MIAAYTAAILAFVLYGSGAIFTIMMARQACPELAEWADKNEGSMLRERRWPWHE